MTDWKNTFDEARQEFPDPLNDTRRFRKKRAIDEQWQAPPIDELLNQIAADNRAHDNARRLSDRKQARESRQLSARTTAAYRRHPHGVKQSDSRGWIVTIAVMLPVCLCLSAVWMSYVP